MAARYLIFLITAIFLLFNCEGSETEVSNQNEVFDTSGFDLQALDNGLVRLTKRDSDGYLYEEGFLKDGRPFGTWVTWSDRRLRSITSYYNGKKNGKSFTFNTLVQLESIKSHTDDVKDGLQGKYSGRYPIEELNYNMGVLDGVQRYYFPSGMEKGKLQREIMYVDGEVDGFFRQYNPDGELVLEYTYEDGERVSGGIVN